MKEFLALRAKTYAYLMEDDSEHKRAKGTKKCIIKGELRFENFKDSLFNDKIILKSQQRFRSGHYKVCTEEFNKIALSSNNDKRLQTFDRLTTYPYGFNENENEMPVKNKLSGPDKDKNTPKTKTEDKDKSTPKTRTKTEDKDKDKTTPKTRTKTEDRLIQVFQYAKLCRNKKKMVIGQKDRFSMSFGIMSIYLNYVKSRYAMIMNMHTHGLRSFPHILVRYFLLESIRQSHQKINQTLA